MLKDFGMILLARMIVPQEPAAIVSITDSKLHFRCPETYPRFLYTSSQHVSYAILEKASGHDIAFKTPLDPKGM